MVFNAFSAEVASLTVESSTLTAYTVEGNLSVVPYPVIACSSISIAEVVPVPVYL